MQGQRAEPDQERENKHDRSQQDFQNELRYEKIPATFMPPFVGIGTDRNRLRPRLVITADSPVMVKRTHGIGKHIRHTFHSKLRCNLCGGLACVETIVVVAFMDRGFQRVPAGHVYAKGFPVGGQLIMLDGILCALLIDRDICGFRSLS